MLWCRHDHQLALARWQVGQVAARHFAIATSLPHLCPAATRCNALFLSEQASADGLHRLYPVVVLAELVSVETCMAIGLSPAQMKKHANTCTPPAFLLLLADKFVGVRSERHQTPFCLGFQSAPFNRQSSGIPSSWQQIPRCVCVPPPPPPPPPDWLALPIACVVSMCALCAHCDGKTLSKHEM